jgi:hypothetical protein
MFPIFRLTGQHLVQEVALALHAWFWHSVPGNMRLALPEQRIPLVISYPRFTERLEAANESTFSPPVPPVS